MKIGKKATNLIVWASAYVNVVVFALCGGYAWFKSNDETVKNETKKALIVTLLFTAVGMIQSFVGQCLSLFGVSYGSDLYSAHQMIANVISIANIVVYAVFALLAFFKNDNAAANGKTFAENHFGFGQVGESRRDGYGYAAVNVCAFVGEKSDSVIAVENGNKVLVDFKILRFVVCGKGKPEIGGVRH